MASISVDPADKKEFKEMKPDELTQKQFFAELLAAKRRDEGEIVDVDEMVEEIKHRVVTNAELAAYRGTKEALENGT